MLEAFQEAVADAGVERRQIEAAMARGVPGGKQCRQDSRSARQGLRLHDIPATRWRTPARRAPRPCEERFTRCVRRLRFPPRLGSRKAQRNRLRRTAPSYPRHDDRPVAAQRLGAGRVSPLAAPTAASSLAGQELKRAMAHVSVKSHENGFRAIPRRTCARASRSRTS